MRNRVHLTAGAALLCASFLIVESAVADAQRPPLSGAISGGRQHQPTQSEIVMRELMRGEGSMQAHGVRSTLDRDDLYQRILAQSRRTTPRAIEP
jgi:Spy/CpxP family protein refolding chaperone